MASQLTQQGRRLRVALLGIYHESNTFISRPTTLENFKDGHWLTGDAIRSEYKDSFHEIGGMLEVMDANDMETIPVMFAEATPGGVVSSKTYHTLLKQMLDGLTALLPLDGCLVVPHGAGVAEGYDDMDGHWLSEVRKLVGDKVPVVGTLDPHANVSPRMAQATDALVAYKTNPHIDQRETGRSAAEILIRALRKEIAPVQLLVQTPIAISIEQQNTSGEPCKRLHEYARELTRNEKVLSVSLLLGFPYADVEDMGSAFIIVSDDLPESELQRLGDGLRSRLISEKEKCVGEMKNINSILPAITDLPRPVLLLDMGDNIGGGSPGDSAYLLDAIERDGNYRSFHCIFDPAAVAVAAGYHLQDTFELSFGNTDAIKGGPTFKNKVTLLLKSHGKFTEKKPRHGGQVNYDMGEIVIVKTEAGNTVLLNSLRVPPFSLSQITTFGIRPEDYDLIVAKGVNAPIAAYGVVCPSIIQVNTPGVTQADMTSFHFKKRRKPLFPFEKKIT